MPKNSSSNSSEVNRTVDRLLGVASPLMAKELDVVMQQFRANLEDEFRIRAENERLQAVEETRKSVRVEVTEEMEARFKEEFKIQLEEFRNSIEEDSRQAKVEFGRQISQKADQIEKQRTNLTREITRWRLLAHFSVRIGEASSQIEILTRFLTLAEQFADGVALYLNKPTGLELWRSRGDVVFPNFISDETIDPESFFSRILVRNKTVAAVYADNVEELEFFPLLVKSLTKAIEDFGLRLRFFRSLPSLTEIE